MQGDPAGGVPFLWIVVPAGGDEPALDDLLSERERALYDGLRFSLRRKKWLLGRVALKKLLVSMLSVSEREITILNEPSGAPFVEIEGRGRLDRAVSISHRAEWGAAAVALEPVRGLGIDIETVEPRSEALFKDYFTPAEIAVVEVRSADRDTAIALTWSAKEAVLKALGVGLRLDTRCIEVRLPLDVAEQWAPIGIALSGEAKRDGVVRGYGRVERGYVVTAAVVG